MPSSHHITPEEAGPSLQESGKWPLALFGLHQRLAPYFARPEPYRLCCKKRGTKKWKRERPSQMFLGCDSKQSGDQCDLPSHISFVHPVHLSFPNHVHHLKSPQRSPRCLEGEEAHPRPC
jgi:hypothetical protein